MSIAKYRVQSPPSIITIGVLLEKQDLFLHKIAFFYLGEFDSCEN